MMYGNPNYPYVYRFQGRARIVGIRKTELSSCTEGHTLPAWFEIVRTGQRVWIPDSEWYV